MRCGVNALDHHSGEHGPVLLTPIATTKSTVLGVRLDHDRRAWLEAAAARHGVTVRVLFEEMIDQARSEDAPPARPPTRDALGDDAVDWLSGVDGIDLDAGPTGTDDDFPVQGDAEGVAAAPHFGSSSSGPAPSGLGGASFSDVRRLLALPGRVLGAAASLTAAHIEASGRCARDGWRAAAGSLRQMVP